MLPAFMILCYGYDILRKQLERKISSCPKKGNRIKFHTLSQPEYPEPHTYITSPAICRNAIRSEFDEVKQIAVDNIRDSQSALAKFSAKMETKLHGNEGTIK